MPEGDTIHRAAAALRAALIGKATTAFQAPRLDGIMPAPGSVIERVESHGKHLEIGWDDGCVLHTHMRMSGSWHLYRPGENWRKSSKQMRVVIEVPGWQAVCFSAPVVETYRAGEFTRHPVAGSLGPDLCREDADLADCVDRMARFCDAELSVGEALLDQRVACGVGNVYKSEVLWACELDPFTPVGALDVEQRTKLIEVAAYLLRANLERPTRVTTTGTPEGLSVYGRFGKPCPRCATPIEVRKHGEQARVTYWCPGCQLYIPLPEPDPDAMPSESSGRARRFAWRRKNRRDDGATAAAEGNGGRPAASAWTETDPGDRYGSDDEYDRSHYSYGARESQPARYDRHDPYAPAADADARFDRHPAARAFMAGRSYDLSPSYVDPLLAPDT